MEQICALLHASGLPKTLWGEAACHVVWLLNHTLTKAVDGKTPFEAAFGKKPNLRHVHEWGEKVWVHIKEGDKLGGRVKEGCWLGVADQSKGFRIYWPGKGMVTTEQNVYYNEACTSVDCLEGEDWEFIETTMDVPQTQISKPPPMHPQNPTPQSL